MSSPDIHDLQSIVAALNEPPFNQSLTLVAFSELRGYEALQLLNDVIAVVDPKQKKDIRDENADATWIRIVDFLGVCKYPNLPMADLASFQSALMSGSPDVHHALIFWIIQNLHTAQKRCHLARFLRPPELPDQLMADADVVSERQRHLVLQSEFKTVHQAYDKMKGTALNPQQLQEEIQTLEHEKEKLLQKLAKMKEKVTNGAEFQNVVFDDVLRVTNQLRREQEEEQRIAQQTREQKHKVIRAEQIKAQTAKKLSEMQTNDVSRMDPNKLLQRLRNDVKMQRELCEEKLEKAIREKEKNLRELEKTMSSEPMSIEEVEDLEHELDGLRQHVEDLTAKRDHMHRSSDGQLSFMRNSIIASERKRDAAIEKLSETEEEFKEAEDDLRRIQADLNSLSVDGQPPKTEAQMKQYMKDLAVKTETYKKYKAELEADRAEVGVLSRTEAILKSRDDNLAEFNAELEKQRGVAGFQTAQETLENISADKANIDTTKGETLEQISNIVTQINSTLKERKNNLAPKIKDLRAVRLKFEEIEQVYTAKKKVYDNVALGLESERLKLDQDVQANLQGVAEEETSYHSFHIAQQIQNVRAQMMAAESRYQSGQERLSTEYKSYREMYEKGIMEQEALSKALRVEKKNLTEKHEGDVAQRSMFLQLRKLLNAKVTIQKQLKEQQAQDPYQQMGGGGGMGMGMGMGMNMGMAGAYPPYGGQQYGGNSMIME